MPRSSKVRREVILYVSLFRSTRPESIIVTWSSSVSTSLTWWVEISTLLSSVMVRDIARRNWLFDGMSNPLVGSSIKSRGTFVARAKHT